MAHKLLLYCDVDHNYEGDMFPIEFGKRLKEIRKKKYKFQRVFADLLSRAAIPINSNRYSKIERGIVFPRIDEVRQICTLLNCSADEWLGLRKRDALYLDYLTDDERRLLTELYSTMLKIRNSEKSVKNRRKK
jgi:transcriptional regulator with XRE-family HTH domain